MQKEQPVLLLLHDWTCRYILTLKVTTHVSSVASCTHWPSFAHMFAHNWAHGLIGVLASSGWAHGCMSSHVGVGIS
jgi:hypothetical protein